MTPTWPCARNSGRWCFKGTPTLCSTWSGYRTSGPRDSAPSCSVTSARPVGAARSDWSAWRRGSATCSPRRSFCPCSICVTQKPRRWPVSRLRRSSTRPSFRCRKSTRNPRVLLWTNRSRSRWAMMIAPSGWSEQPFPPAAAMASRTESGAPEPGSRANQSTRFISTGYASAYPIDPVRRLALRRCRFGINSGSVCVARASPAPSVGRNFGRVVRCRCASLRTRQSGLRPRRDRLGPTTEVTVSVRREARE
jgi:hypothetical protein